MLKDGRYAVYNLRPSDKGETHKQLAAVFALKHGGFHLLEDHANVFAGLHEHDGEAPSELLHKKIKHLIDNSAYTKVVPTKEDNIHSKDERHKNDVEPMDLSGGRQVFSYKHQNHDAVVPLVYENGSFNLNGYPLSIDELKHLREEVEGGNAHVHYPDDMFKSEGDFEDLAKAVLPKDLRNIARGVTEEGKQFVDHKDQMGDIPEGVKSSIRLYRAMESDPRSSKASGSSFSNGISRKSIFKLAGRTSGKMHRDVIDVEKNPVTGEDVFTSRRKPSQLMIPQVGAQSQEIGVVRQGTHFVRVAEGKAPDYLPKDELFMLKPYHELLDRRIKKWMHAPIQGWAEIANQALYHAGGIGDLHQKVFIVEHPFRHGKDPEPMLAIHTGHGFTPVAKRGPGIVTDKTQDQVRKIALMDFLTNNLDRHHGNLLINDSGDLLAIDHSRSFQYLNSDKKPAAKKQDLYDSIGTYLGKTPAWVGNGINEIIRSDPKTHGPMGRLYHSMPEWPESFEPTFDWWGKNSQNIRNAMYEQLRHIKDEKIRKHIKLNFDIRADQLDNMVKHGVTNFGTDFHHTAVPLIRPWEH